MLIGDEGIGYYQLSYPLYMFFVAMASGVPIAISKMISEKNAVGDIEGSYEVVKESVYLMAYERADIVTSLYQRARNLQIELGCPKDKIRITPNGIDVDRLANLPGKSEEEKKWIYAGAVLRVTPIKDVKTMIQSFAFAKKKVPELKLWIMGPTDEDEKYARECFELVDMLGVEDIEFTGRVDVRDYLGKMDFTLLTSISEGQPLTILESYAAHCPVIATDVGNCRELIYGPTDSFGSAGILTHIMNLEEIAQAMIDLAQNKKLRYGMGEAGYKRVQAFYRIDQMKAVLH